MSRSLRKCTFSNLNVKFDVKGKVYSTNIIPILLYGVECWSLTERLLITLRNFHYLYIRRHVNRYQIWIQRISYVELLYKVRLKSIDSYLCKRQMTWAGHVIRMPWFRLLSILLGSLETPKRAPRYTFGRSLYKTLRKCNIDKLCCF